VPEEKKRHWDGQIACFQGISEDFRGLQKHKQLFYSRLVGERQLGGGMVLCVEGEFEAKFITHQTQSESSNQSRPQKLTIQISTQSEDACVRA